MGLGVACLHRELKQQQDPLCLQLHAVREQMRVTDEIAIGPFLTKMAISHAQARVMNRGIQVSQALF